MWREVVHFVAWGFVVVILLWATINKMIAGVRRIARFRRIKGMGFFDP
jgi:hypothetical protein